MRRLSYEWLAGFREIGIDQQRCLLALGLALLIALACLE